MTAYVQRVESALNDLRQGKMIILVDHPDRENEGDLIFPAETINQNVINFMIRHCSGIICLPMKAAQLKKLGLSYMVPPHENSSQRGTPFTTSIEARAGVTTGVSAADRATTILAAVHDHAHADDLVKPGHIFPLHAREGGVLERAGHTEGAVDLVRLAGFKSAAVLCELMNPDGTMMHGDALEGFAKTHQLNILAIEDLIRYRRLKENLITETTTATIPIEGYGNFSMTVMREAYHSQEHIVLTSEKTNFDKPVLTRIHSSCMTGDLFKSKRCDCHAQLNYALERMGAEGGVLIYLNQEGRGVGLFNKIKAYALQEQGLDTVEANQALQLPADLRHYYIAANILRLKNIHQVRLLTNNPAKVNDLKDYGIAQVEREIMPVFSNEQNKNYLLTKKNKLNHLFANDLSSASEG